MRTVPTASKKLGRSGLEMESCLLPLFEDELPRTDEPFVDRGCSREDAEEGMALEEILRRLCNGGGSRGLVLLRFRWCFAVLTYRRGTAGKSAPVSWLARSALAPVLSNPIPPSVLLWWKLGRLPFARRTESRIVALPKEGDRCRCFGKTSGMGTGGAGFLLGGAAAGNCCGRRPDCARKESAVIQSSCLACDIAVNFSARCGVKMRIDRLNAALSSAPFGSGELS